MWKVIGKKRIEIEKLCEAGDFPQLIIIKPRQIENENQQRQH